VDHLIEKISRRTGKRVRTVSDEVMETLLRHSWPGNVRELENIIESAIVRTRGDIIVAPDLPDAFLAGPTAPAQRDERVKQALRRTAGCVTRAARLLGMHRTTLWRHMREAGLHREDFLV
jgi:transcriptional regulator of acetoin/glycerol metabolism